MRKVHLCLLIVISLVIATPSIFGANSPSQYIPLSAVEKRDFHRERGLDTEMSTDQLSDTWSGGCRQMIAFQTVLSPSQLRKTFVEPSGYASSNSSDSVRRNYGKGIHSRGPMAPGEWELKEPLLGLSPGRHPVTYRFSFANPYVPLLPGATARPGFLIIVHRDGLPDMNLFVMPEKGLDGFRADRNPFHPERPYTNYLAKPSLPIRTVAALTFGQVVTDVYTQLVTREPLRNYQVGEPNIPSRDKGVRLELHPDRYWYKEYQDRANSDYRVILREIEVPEEGTRLFNGVWGFENGKRFDLGEMTILGSWLNSNHSDEWFARHEGFILR